MEFIISHTEIKAPNGDRAFGIDIQGHLGTLGVQGVAEELAKREPGFSSGRDQLASEATVTRNVDDGAALIVRPNQYRALTSGDAAQAVATLINPCNVHEVTFMPPLES